MHHPDLRYSLKFNLWSGPLNLELIICNQLIKFCTDVGSLTHNTCLKTYRDAHATHDYDSH